MLMQAKIHNITVKFIFKPTQKGMDEITIDTKIPQMTIPVSSMDRFSIRQRKWTMMSMKAYATKVIRNITRKLNPQSL